MSLIHDPEMCPTCETRNCQHPRHHVPLWEVSGSGEENGRP